MGRSLTNGNINHNVKKLIDHLSQWSKAVKSVEFLIKIH
jgi:hypothetical protein